jgi:hypothetical protein
VKIALVLCLCLTLVGCRASDPVAPIKLQHLPPAAKDVIDAAMAGSQISMSDPSCKGFGTEPTDKTIGRYLAGYLAELSSQDARNAVTTSIQPGKDGDQAVYVCRLMIRHAQGEDIWSWGIQFSVRQSDGVVLARSFQCVGAG